MGIRLVQWQCPYCKRHALEARSKYLPDGSRFFEGKCYSCKNEVSLNSKYKHININPSLFKYKNKNKCSFIYDLIIMFNIFAWFVGVITIFYWICDWILPK